MRQRCAIVTAAAAVLDGGEVGANAVAERGACIRTAVAIGGRSAIGVDRAGLDVGPGFGTTHLAHVVGARLWSRAPVRRAAHVDTGIFGVGLSLLKPEDVVATCCERQKEEDETDEPGLTLR